MKRLLLVLALAVSCNATQYFLAPSGLGGSDANNGTSSGTPWLTPNHALNCGDVITAAASTAYSEFNFSTGKWGTVTCAAGNNVAWLKCITFDTCKITATSTNGMWVDNNYWGVQGWEVTSAGSGGFSACFTSAPNFTVPVEIHHIIFANNIANGCQAGGFSTTNSGVSASVDYIAMIGNIAYGAGLTSSLCASNFSIYQPLQSDAAPGTHIYVAGNFAWDSITPAPCGGFNPNFDGEGLTLDTIGGSQGGLVNYKPQIVAENNVFVFNGSSGINSGGGGSPAAPIIIRNNTLYGNNRDSKQSNIVCGELAMLGPDKYFAMYLNILATTGPTGCGSHDMYGFYIYQGDGTSHLYQNWMYSAAAQNYGILSSSGFAQGPSNTAGTSPNFVNPVDPSAPSCSGKTNTVDCMSTVIANYAPQASGAQVYGRQTVSTDTTYDPLFPSWLCNVSLPSGLITTHCITAAAFRQ